MIKYLVHLILLFLFIYNSSEWHNIYVKIITNDTIHIALLTVIAGLFGFIIAIIPFTIQLLSLDSEKNKFIEKLNQVNSIKFIIEPLFKRFQYLLKYLFVLFIYILFLIFLDLAYFELKHILSPILNYIVYSDLYVKNIILALVTYTYFIFIFNFINSLKNLLYKDISSLINTYIQSKLDEK